jgi:hypothetical protein
MPSARASLFFVSIMSVRRLHVSEALSVSFRDCSVRDGLPSARNSSAAWMVKRTLESLCAHFLTVVASVPVTCGLIICILRMGSGLMTSTAYTVALAG